MHLGGERHYESKNLAQERNAAISARVRARNAWSGEHRTNHQATAPPNRIWVILKVSTGVISPLVLTRDTGETNTEQTLKEKETDGDPLALEKWP